MNKDEAAQSQCSQKSMQAGVGGEGACVQSSAMGGSLNYWRNLNKNLPWLECGQEGVGDGVRDQYQLRSEVVAGSLLRALASS